MSKTAIEALTRFSVVQNTLVDAAPAMTELIKGIDLGPEDATSDADVKVIAFVDKMTKLFEDYKTAQVTFSLGVINLSLQAVKEL